MDGSPQSGFLNLFGQNAAINGHFLPDLDFNNLYLLSSTWSSGSENRGPDGADEVFGRDSQTISLLPLELRNKNFMAIGIILYFQQNSLSGAKNNPGTYL